MIAEIISVGTELLLGNILNTNSKYLSERLSTLGIDVYFHVSVGDNKARIIEALSKSVDRSNIIFLTGGLGPTDDDLTKEAVCEFLDKELIVDNGTLMKIKNIFTRRDMDITPNNFKQAYIINDSLVLPNDIGTAPGLLIEDNNKMIVLLPGPPRELELMFSKYLYPKLYEMSDSTIKSKLIKTIGIGESKLETMLSSIIKKQSNPTIATYAKSGQVDIRVSAKAVNDAIADQEINATINKIKYLVSDYIYSYKDESIEEAIFNILSQRNLKVAFCESCTGGLISSRFTRIPGVSSVFERGIITYSNAAKTEELDVDEVLIEKFGAVSSEVAIAMAEGLRKKTKVDVALSVTGIAGPSGGTKYKPVGLVYIGISGKESTYSIKFNFHDNRVGIQEITATNAFNELRKYLLKYY